jgi:3,4-dihydroxy 2-butanone 4-phosphate synthase / GTP cyclohydrolase II
MVDSSIAAFAAAADALAAGEFVVVVDGSDRENEADLVGAAEAIDAQRMAFLLRHSSGIACAPMTSARCQSLGLDQMVANNTDQHGTAFTVSVDHVDTGTGVSAKDRARTIRALADPATRREDLRRPGHVFPLRAREGGVLVRSGHTEAAIDLLAKAQMSEVAVICELMNPDGRMHDGRTGVDFAAEHGLRVVHIDQIATARARIEPVVSQVALSLMPTRYGRFRAYAYRNDLDHTEHLALVMGDVAAGRNAQGPLVRVHSECLTGDILGSMRCDCGTQLEESARMIAAEGFGVIIYLRGHEGRGIGLAGKISAYGLQDGGLDTVAANIALGAPIDGRDYLVGAQILADLGVLGCRLITNNPAKLAGLAKYGADIAERVGLPGRTTAENVNYLRSKRDRMGHLIDIEEDQLCSKLLSS